MSNNNNCFIPPKVLNRPLYNVLRFTIQGTCRLIQNEDRSVKIQSPCQYNPLTLTTTQLTACFPDHSIQSMFKILYKMPYIRFSTCIDDLFFILILIRQTNIIPDRIMKQNRFLRYNTDQRTKRRF